MSPRTIASANALLEFRIHGQLKHFSFMYQIKNKWTIEKLYNEIAAFILRTNFEYFIHSTAFTLFYNNYALSPTSQALVGQLDNMSTYPQFLIKMT